MGSDPPCLAPSLCRLRLSGRRLLFRGRCPCPSSLPTCPDPCQSCRCASSLCSTTCRLGSPCPCSCTGRQPPPLLTSQCARPMTTSEAVAAPRAACRVAAMPHTTTTNTQTRATKPTTRASRQCNLSQDSLSQNGLSQNGYGGQRRTCSTSFRPVRLQ